MSTINTNGIDVNYPVPGVNNSTQGFRDNFANIKTSLNTAASEITDLQNSVVLKQALANSVLNNDMAGALISNATTRGFRASTYNLGNALSGTVVVDVSLGDVQYGNIAGNVSFEFQGWTPLNTTGSVVLNLGVTDPNAVINFPSEVVSTFDGFGVTILENYGNLNNTATVTVPNGVTQLSYELKSLDCGNTISITPLNRPFQSTQIQGGTPPSTGLRGDVKGTVSVGSSVTQVAVTSTSNTTVKINASVVSMPASSINGTILTVGTTDNATMNGCYIDDTTLYVGALSTGNIQIGMELTGTGVTPGTTIIENIEGTGTDSFWKVSISQTVPPGTIIIGQTPIQVGMLLSGPGILADTYIVSNDNGTGAGSTWNINRSQFIVSSTITGTTGIVGGFLYVGQIVEGSIAPGTIISGIGIVENTTVVNNISGTGSNSIWVISEEQYVSPTTITGVRNAITCNSTVEFYLDMPIVFTGEQFGGLFTGTTYYIKDIMTSTDFSVTTIPGGNGTTVNVTTDSGTMYGNPVNYLYVCSQDYDSTVIGPKTVSATYSVSNFIQLSDTVGLIENSPIIFTGSAIGGLAPDTAYYIKTIDSGNANIQISLTKINGLAGSTYELGDATSASANAFVAYSTVGSDIWRQIPLLPGIDANSNIAGASLFLTNDFIVQGNGVIDGNLTVNGTVDYGNVSYGNLEISGDLDIGGNITANHILTNTLTTTGLTTFSDIANIIIPGGSPGYYIQTDGTGNLVWAAGTGSGGGGGGEGGGSFVYTQATPATTWTVNHNLGVQFVNVEPIDATGESYVGRYDYPTITFVDAYTVELEFDTAVSGYVAISAGGGSGGGSGTAAGAAQELQYNNGGGGFAANAGLKFVPVSQSLVVANNVLVGNALSGPSGNIFAESANAFVNNFTTNTLTVSGLANLSSNSDVKIYGGTTGQYLQTDGAGNLFWVDGTVEITGTASAAGTQGDVQISNGAGGFNAVTGFTYSTVSSNLTIPGNIVTSSPGHIFANSSNIVGNLLVANYANISANLVASNVKVNANLTGNWANFSNNIRTGAIFANTNTTIDPSSVTAFAAGQIVEGGFSGPGIVIGSSAAEHGAIVYDSTINAIKFATENGILDNTMQTRAILYSNSTFATDKLSGILTTPNQPNITEVGTLANLRVLGNITANNFYGGLANGGSNVRIPYTSGNVNISAVGNANVFVVTGSGANSNGYFTAVGNILASGDGSGIGGKFVTVNGNAFGRLDVSANITGNLGLRALPVTYYDNVTAASGIIPLAAAHAIGAPTFDSQNSAVTLNEAATFYIKGAVQDGVNTILDPSNSYALYVDGNTKIIGNTRITNLNTGNVTLTGNLNLPSVDGLKIPGGTTGYYLQATGDGDMVWSPGTGTSSGLGGAAGFAGAVQFNDGTGVFDSSPGFKFTEASGNLEVPGNIIAAANVTAANIFGTVSTPIQTQITSVGTLVSLTSTGNIWASGVDAGLRGRYVTADGVQTGNIDTSNPSLAGNLGIRGMSTKFTDNTTSTSIANGAPHVFVAPQIDSTTTGVTVGNISTVLIKGAPTACTNVTFGNAYALTVDGNVKLNSNVTITGNTSIAGNTIIPDVTKFKILGGTAGYYLRTNGSGELEWWSGTVAPGSITAVGNTQEVQFNLSGSLTASANFKYNPTGNVLTVTGIVTTNELQVKEVYYQNTKATIDGQVLRGYANGKTYWAAAGSGTSIENGTSQITIPDTNGNINITPTAANFAIVNGNLLVTNTIKIGSGNLTINTVPSVNQSYLRANTDGSTYWTSAGAGTEIANGTTSVVTNTANVELKVGSTTIANVTSSGMQLASGKTMIVNGVTYVGGTYSAGHILTINGSGVTSWAAPAAITAPTSIAWGSSNVKILTSGGGVEVNATQTEIKSTLTVTGAATLSSGLTTAGITAQNVTLSGNVTAPVYRLTADSFLTVTSSRDFDATDNGKILYVNAGVTLTCPAAPTLSKGFSVVVIQATVSGSSKVTIAAGSGVTLGSFGSAYKTAGQYATISIVCPVDSTYIISGQTSTT